MNKYLSEFIGTFALVFCGCGAIVIDQVSGGTVGHQGIAVSFGLIVLAMIYTFGDISGAHFNPAVSISFWAAKRFKSSELLPYITAQISGGILASYILKLLFPEALTMGESLPAGSDMQSFVLEVILTFFLILVILHVSKGAKEKGITAGIAISSVVLLEAYFAGPICGASMNPARSIAPALTNLNFQSLWVYLTAPVLGGLIAVLAYRFTSKPVKS